MVDETMGVTKETQNCRCLELEERVLKAEESYVELESKMQDRIKEIESLESKKLAVEKELRNLKVSWIDQMYRNEALEVEKHTAEKEAEEWKRKFEKLVETVPKLSEIGALRVEEYELDENVKLGLELASIKFPVANHQISGSPFSTTPVKDYMSGRNRDNMSSSRANKMLVYDSCKSTHEKESDGEEYEDEDVEPCEVDTLPGRKRKRVITSDSEDDDDEDNIPIATLKNLKPQKNQEMSDLVDDTPSSIGESESGGFRRQRRLSSRLRKQRVLKDNFTPSEPNPTGRLVGIPITGNAEDDETEEEESEGESLDGFIVDDEPESEESDDTEGDDVPEEGSDEETSYADVMSRLRRDKKKPGEKKWEYEADMLADFGKDLELCMRAVCVLYMFQTEGEKASRSSHVTNGRGFSMSDAERGTRIGQFLTDGEPSGDLKKSVEELQSFEYKADEICRDLASRYSKQLFQIYKNREVTFFSAPPSP